MGSRAVSLPEADLSEGIGIDASCNACGACFDTVLPVFIDAERNPDTVAFAASGSLRNIACVRCGAVIELNAPLLWITRSKRPHLFLCCDSLLSPDNPDNMQFLVSNLAGKLGGLPDDWTADKLQTIEHRFLPYLLERCANPEPRQWIADIQWRLILAAQMPVGNFAALSALADLYPELLWAPAEKTLGRMLKAAAERGDGEAESRFGTVRTSISILRLANGINIDPLASLADEGGIVHG